MYESAKFLFLLLGLLGLAGFFLLALWRQANKKERVWLLGVCALLSVGTLTGYRLLGAPSTVFYAQDNHHLRQINSLLESQATLDANVQHKIEAELERQLSRDTVASTVWLLKGKLAMQGKNYALAAKAYQEAHQLEPENPDISIDYATARYLENNQSITPALAELLASLQANYPLHPGVLNLQAAIAFRQGEFAKAILYWQDLLKQYPPNSPDAATIKFAIQQSNALL